MTKLRIAVYQNFMIFDYERIRFVVHYVIRDHEPTVPHMISGYHSQVIGRVTIWVPCLENFVYEKFAEMCYSISFLGDLLPHSSEVATII